MGQSVPSSMQRVAACLLIFTLISALPVGSAFAGDEDPLEGFNRKVFVFNEFLDRHLLIPAARGYRAATPDPVDRGVTNIMENIGELPTIVNDLLQCRLGHALRDSGRFLINTTVGILGLFDVASDLGLERNQQDFGLTLARWGFDSGPFLMLPFFGPSTVRDGLGRIPDVYFQPLNYIDEEEYRYSAIALRYIDIRADLLDAEDLIAGDRYVFLRDVWLQQRRYQVTGEAPEDDFGDDDF